MSRVVVWRDFGWYTEVGERGIFHMLCEAYRVGLELLNETGWPEFRDDETIVLMDEQGTVMLDDFEHPDNAVYVFGRSGQNDMIEKVPHDHSVCIPYPAGPGKRCLMAISACSIVLADRLRKMHGCNN